MAISPRWPAAAICAALAIAVPLAARAVVGPPGAVVHVRWQSSVDASTRRALEDRFQLEAGELQDGQTWRYDLRGTRRTNIQALVDHAAVADTHHIDRRSYGIDPAATRTARPQPFPVTSEVILRLADMLALLLAVTAILVWSGRAASGRSTAASAWNDARSGARRLVEPVAHWVGRWVPDLDAAGLGAFRVALGCGFVWVALSRQLTALPAAQQQHRALVDFDLIHRLAASQTACDAIELVMLIAAVVFTAGVRARVSYAAFVAGFALSTLVTLERTSAHDLGLPLVTFLGWLTVPWDHGRLGPRSSGRSERLEPPRAYGFALWWPGLTVGVALLAAAYWKLHVSGLGWITGGAVKYHFIADSGNAHVDWGLRLASNHGLAVMLSAGAIVAEAAFIANIFIRRPWPRLAIGLMSAAFFVALYLFQGIFWPAWHILFLAFLPWGLLNARDADVAVVAGTRAPRLQTAQALVVVALLAVQMYASASGREAEPVMSHFPMYAHSYGSVEDFEASLKPRLTRVLAARADDHDIRDDLVALADNDRFLLMDLAERSPALRAELTEREHRDRELLCRRYEQSLGRLPQQVALAIERRAFDWRAGRFTDYVPVHTTPVPLAAMCRHLTAARQP
jgi:hypothetical protein